MPDGPRENRREDGVLSAAQPSVCGQTRAKVIRAFHFLKHKKVETLKKKHGNIPI